MTNESERAYCRACGEGCEVSFAPTGKTALRHPVRSGRLSGTRSSGFLRFARQALVRAVFDVHADCRNPNRKEGHHRNTGQTAVPFGPFCDEEDRGNMAPFETEFVAHRLRDGGRITGLTASDAAGLGENSKQTA